jgi:hypothetical protein
MGIINIDRQIDVDVDVDAAGALISRINEGTAGMNE